MALGQLTSQRDYAIGKSSRQRKNNSDNRIDVISWVSASFPKLSQSTKFHFCPLRYNTTKIAFCKADIPQLGCPLSVSIQERIQPTIIFNSVKGMAKFYNRPSKRDSNFQIKPSGKFPLSLPLYIQSGRLPTFIFYAVQNIALLQIEHYHSKEYSPHIQTQSRILPTFM